MIESQNCDYPYYSFEGLKDFSFEIVELIDTIKYLYSLNPTDKDYKILTAEYKEELQAIAKTMVEYQRALEFYQKNA